MGLALVTEDKSEWYRCRPWIEAALEYAHGTHTIEDIEDGIALGQFQFFCSENAAVVTEFIKYPQMKVLNYFLIGGDLNELADKIEPHVSRWAKMKGCKRVIGIGRRGLERVFGAKGFAYAWTGIYKDL